MALRIGTSEYGGTFYTQGMVLAELFNRSRSENDRCEVKTTDASIHNAEQLDRGELEFGFMASNWIGRAKNATPPFTKRIAIRMDSISSGRPRSAAHPATLTSINLRSSKSWRIEVCAASPGKSAVVVEISSGSVTTTPRPCLVTRPRTTKDFKASRIVVRPTPNTEQRLRSEGSRSPDFNLPCLICS